MKYNITGYGKRFLLVWNLPHSKRWWRWIFYVNISEAFESKWFGISFFGFYLFFKL